VLNAFRHHRGGRPRRQQPANRLAQCSTPFGITEVGARNRAGLPHRSLVLNAFRHHRGGRLRRFTAVRSIRPSAQRLSASQRWARAEINPAAPALRVLNAFRHHRGGRSRWCDEDPQIAAVLNAFRHHRGGRSEELRYHRSARECSTPFGITEVGAARSAPSRRERPVLNAFRHHRGGRLIGGDYYVGYALCSTPFGITEVGARLYPARIALSSCVLNAFRHHRGGRRIPYRILYARRLCSTPFGITEVGALVQAARAGLVCGCSTPFGITEVGAIPAGQYAPPQLGAQRLSASQRWAHWPR